MSRSVTDDWQLQLEGRTGKLDMEIVMEMLSRTYGWTPLEIKQQPLHDIENYLVIIGIRNRIASFREKYGQ